MLRPRRITKRTTTFYLDEFEGEALMKDAVDLGSAGQVGGVHLISRPLDALFKVHAELLHHPVP